MSSKQGKLLISWYSRRVCTQFIKEYHHVYLVEGKKEGIRTRAAVYIWDPQLLYPEFVPTSFGV